MMEGVETQHITMETSQYTHIIETCGRPCAVTDNPYLFVAVGTGRRTFLGQYAGTEDFSKSPP